MPHEQFGGPAQLHQDPAAYFATLPGGGDNTVSQQSPFGQFAPTQDPAALLAALQGSVGQQQGQLGQPAPQQDPAEILRTMLTLAADYRDAEADDEDLLLIEQATTLIQRLLAKAQKERDGLLQGKASPSALRRFGG